MAMTAPDQLRTWLDGVRYPAGRDELVRQAEHNSAPQDVVAALRAMPPVEYANRADVIASVDVRDEQTDAENADSKVRVA